MYRATAPGTPLWEMDGYRAILFLADDGDHLVERHPGGNLLDADVRPTEAFLTFFLKSRNIGTVPVGELFSQPDRLPRTASGLAWGDILGFDRPKRFAVLLYDGRKLVFDTDTGKQTRSIP